MNIALQINLQIKRENLYWFIGKYLWWPRACASKNLLCTNDRYNLWHTRQRSYFRGSCFLSAASITFACMHFFDQVLLPASIVFARVINSEFLKTLLVEGTLTRAIYVKWLEPWRSPTASPSVHLQIFRHVALWSWSVLREKCDKSDKQIPNWLSQYGSCSIKEKKECLRILKKAKNCEAIVSKKLRSCMPGRKYVIRYRSKDTSQNYCVIATSPCNPFIL